jgi:hypothetical protein
MQVAIFFLHCQDRKGCNFFPIKDRTEILTVLKSQLAAVLLTHCQFFANLTQKSEL